MRRAVSPTDTQAGQDRCEAHHFSHTASRKPTSWRHARGGGENPMYTLRGPGAPNGRHLPAPSALRSPPPWPPEGPGGAGRGGAAAGRLPQGRRPRGAGSPAGAGGRCWPGSARLRSAGIRWDRHGSARHGTAPSGGEPGGPAMLPRYGHRAALAALQRGS